MSQPTDSPSSWNLPFTEQLYSEFLRAPASVDPECRQFFQQTQTGETSAPPRAGPSFHPAGLFQPRAEAPAPPDALDEAKITSLQNRVTQLVRNYRVRGHNIAAVDPLGLPRPRPPELELGFYGFSDEEMDRPVAFQALRTAGPGTVREILQHLQDTYCRSIGVQYMHIDNFEIRL